MKTISATIIVMLCVFSTTAQVEFANFSAAIAGNYTMYRGDFQQKTPGAKIDLGYNITSQIKVGLAYTYHSAIKVQSPDINSSNGTTIVFTPADYQYKFKTIALNFSYSFVGSEEQAFSAFGNVTSGIVFVKEKQVPRTALPANTTMSSQQSPQTESGIVLGLGLGLQYKIGPVATFADAGIVLPSPQGQTYSYSEPSNPIPFHYSFNVGVRIPFGTRSFDE